MSGLESSPIPATNLLRYSVTPTDVQTVRQQLNAADKCDDQMIQQFVQATGGDLTTVGVCFHLTSHGPFLGVVLAVIVILLFS